jgi:hypothetical protein
MSDQRIKGQEVQVLIVNGGNLEDTLTDIQNFNVTVEQEVKSVGYLGEKTNRKDSIFNGIKFDMELHIHKSRWFGFVKDMIAKSKREKPDIKFNITGVFSFPNGETPTMLLPDCSLGEVPHSVQSRGDYVKVKLQGECDDWEVAGE